MTKEELVALIQEKAELETKTSAEQVLDSILESMQEELSRGESVGIRNFGTFDVVKRAARKGRNPQTGEEIQIDAFRTVKFTPGKLLKDAAAHASDSKLQSWLNKKEITKNMETTLKDYRKKVDDYFVDKNFSGEARKVYRDSMDKVKPKYEEARMKLKLLKASSGDAWDEVRTGFEKAFSELKDAFSKAMKKM